MIVAGPHASEGATILVADDNEAIRALLRTLLQRAGHRAIEAADGRAALAVAAANDLDLALLDVQMPYRSARSVDDAHRELTSGAGTQFDPDLLAIFQTALAEDPDLHADVLVRTRGLRVVRGAA